ESPIRGWTVLTTARHVPALYDLSPDELRRLGPLAARVMNAQKEALGAVHAYAYALGDRLNHFHLHLVPRFADTPERLRGGRIFTAGPEGALPPADIEAAAEALKSCLTPRGGAGAGA